MSFTLLGGALTLTTPRGYPRPPEDALHLTAFANPPHGAYGLDAGCGIGTVSLALLHRRQDLTLHGVDINRHLAAAAAHNAIANNLPLTAAAEDILHHTPPAPYGFILCNPPFHEQARGHTSPNPLQNQRHGMPPTLLEDWLAHFLAITKPSAHLYFILHTHQQARMATLAQQHGLHATFAHPVSPLVFPPVSPPQTSLNLPFTSPQPPYSSSLPTPKKAPKRVLVHLAKNPA